MDEARRGVPPGQHGNEEKFDLKRMFLRSILAAIPAVLLPLCAAGQVAADSEQAPAANAQPAYKYEAYAGFGYTSLNQVNQSRYGLMGVDLSLTRDWGRYFGITGVANYYKPALRTGGATSEGNPGDPSIYEVLTGPELRAPLYGGLSGFFRGEIGIEHTGGEGMSPSLSFAGGVGGGLTYSLTPRLAIRLAGDKIGASFPVRDTPPGYSPHRSWNSSGTIGVVYRF
jgi:hypothetical protein